MKVLVAGILLLLGQPAFSSPAKRNEHPSYHTRACGDVIFEEKEPSDLIFADHSLGVCRLDATEGDQSWKTPRANLSIHVSKEDLEDSSLKQIMNQALADRLDELVSQKFNEDLNHLSTNEAVKSDVMRFRDSLVKSLSSNPKRRVKEIFALYPEFVDQLLTEAPDYKPLVCQYYRVKRNEKIIKNLAGVLALSSSVFIPSTIVAFGFLNIFKLPFFMYLGGGVKAAAGIVQIRNGVVSWNLVKASRLAKKRLKLDDEIQHAVDQLEKKKNRNPEQDRAVLILRESLLKNHERQQLETIRGAKKEAVQSLVGGGVNVLFGGLTLYGGYKLDQFLKKIKATKSAEVVNKAPGSPAPGPGGNSNPDPLTPPPPGGFLEGDGG